MTISFDEENHIYRRGDGYRIPSVTDILKEFNLIDSWWYDDASRWRGRCVHQAIDILIKGRELDYDTLDPYHKGYILAFRKLKEDLSLILNPENSEKRIFIPELQVSGRIDYFDSDYLIDWKTGTVGAWTGLQLAGYEWALTGKKRKRIGVQLKPSGNYSINTFDDWRESKYFSILANLFQWKRDHKLLKGDWKYE